MAAIEPGVDRREPALVGIGCVKLSMILHRRRKRERLAAGAGAQIKDLLLRPAAGEQRRKLRALVLNLVPAFAVTGLGLDMGASPWPRALQDADA